MQFTVSITIGNNRTEFKFFTATVVEEKPKKITNKIYKLKKFILYEGLLEKTKKAISGLSRPGLNLLQYRKELLNLTKNLIDEVDNNEKLLFDMITFIEGENRFFSHCVNTAIFTAIFCSLLDVGEEDKYNVIIAALLHDIGKLTFSEEVTKKYLFKKDELSEVDKKHSVWGKRIILYHLRLAKEIGGLVENHHKQLDGVGPSRTTEGHLLTTLDNILITSNFIERILQKLNYGGIDPLRKSFEMMFADNPRRFAPEIKRVLIHVLGIDGERRRFKRFKLAKDAFLVNQTSQAQHPCSVMNISAGGIRIKTDQSLSKDSFYKINIMITENIYVNNKSCKIFWSGKSEGKNVYGLKFRISDERLIRSLTKLIQ